MADFVLALDQGTTSSRAIVFDGTYRIRGLAQREFPQIYPKPGWVEHDPQDLWHTIVETMRSALADAGLAASDIAAIGITNQRETVVVWDRETGRAIHNAIVWQDRRTADLCAALKADGSEVLITDRTGLLADPYFSATKIAWILDNVEGARARAERGELAFGTVDTWLLWHLTGGRRHVTDATNASRTMLCNIDTGEWDEDLVAPVPGAACHPARDQGLHRRFRHNGSGSLRRGDPYSGRSRRPAGGDRGTGLLHAWDDEVHLWHGLLCPSQHRA